MPYSFRFEAIGTPTPTWYVAENGESGGLPSGLRLRSDGILYGTPVFAGDFTFTVIASNGPGRVASQEVTMSVLSRRPPNITAPTLFISNAFADRGDEVTVQLRVIDNPGFTNMIIRVDVPDDLTLLEYESHPALRNNPFTRVGDTMYFEREDVSSNFYGDGPILILIFAVANNAPLGLKPITAELSYSPDTDFQISNGGVRVRVLRMGDVNGDGRATSADATVLARWLIERYVTIDLDAANLSGTGVITTRTLTALVEWLMGHDIRDYTSRYPFL